MRYDIIYKLVLTCIKQIPNNYLINKCVYEYLGIDILILIN